VQLSSDGSSDGKDTSSATGYRVLARKYRPSTFEELIGQDAMVRTLANAFETGRIAQAYMLTGVRGVGKTTTARLIARALNYASPKNDGPTIKMNVRGEHCEAILASNHVDVIEMDAASNTGIDDVREIIEAVRYKPVSARFKVYIIDEVHMLSKQAFNALLKTLEEPPEHVKFIFATTEIRKVPVTVLSRCQRFDLRRLEPELLIEHFASIAQKEAVSAEPDALAMIARASEGSVRDGLSLLDQAIAFGGDTVDSDKVRDMLGLADRARIIDLFENLMKGDAAAALEELHEHYTRGADPAVILTDLADLVHWLTRLKAVPGAADRNTHTQAERARGKALAEALSMPVLTRAWQMLLKGIPEVNFSGNGIAAAEMVLIRMAYAADLPTPDAVIKKLQDAPSQEAPRSAPTPRPAASREPVREPTNENVTEARTEEQAMPVSAPSEENAGASDAPSALASFDDVVKLAGERRDIMMKTGLENHVRLIRFAPGQIEIALEPGAPHGLPNALSRKLKQWTGTQWVISVSDAGGAEPIAGQKRAHRQSLFKEVRALPEVRAVLDKFPGAEIKDVIELGPQGGSGDTNPGDDENFETNEPE
jgi:DNA polymerase-3 subunit gamma/tau